MLIFIPNGVASLCVIGDKFNFVGDLGRLIKSSFCKMNPFVGAPSSGDFSSWDDGDDKSEEGFFLHTSLCLSIDPGRVRGGTRFCGEVRPG